MATVAPNCRAWTERTSYSVGSEIAINCDVQGYPEPRVTWYKDESRIIADNRIQLTSKFIENFLNF